MNSQQAAQSSRISAVEFADDFADLLVCYGNDALQRALGAHFATLKRDNEPIEYDEICRAFLSLVDRKVLVPEFPLNKSALAREQLVELRQRFAPETLPAQPAQTAPSTVSRDGSLHVFVARDANAQDYSRMTKAEFDLVSSFDARRWYKTNASFRKRADYFWNGGK